jgi:hypothetical protein
MATARINWFCKQQSTAFFTGRSFVKKTLFQIWLQRAQLGFLLFSPTRPCVEFQLIAMNSEITQFRVNI